MDRLERRHKESTTLCKMMLTICLKMAEPLGAEHIWPVFKQLLVVMAIKENEGDGKPPMKINGIMKRLHMPRSNVRRALDELVDAGIILERIDGAYVSDMDYVAARIDAEYFKEIKQAVHDTSDALKALAAEQKK